PAGAVERRATALPLRRCPAAPAAARCAPVGTGPSPRAGAPHDQRRRTAARPTHRRAWRGTAPPSGPAEAGAGGRGGERAATAEGTGASADRVGGARRRLPRVDADDRRAGDE